MTWLIIDGIIILVFAIFCIVGSVKGFVKMVMRVFGKIGALIIACLFSGTVGEVLNIRYIGPYFEGLFGQYIQRIAEASEEQLMQTVQEIPEAIKALVAMLGYDLEEVVAGIRTGENISAYTQQIAGPVSEFVSKILAFAAIFVGVLIIAAIVTFILDSLSKLPVINTVNKWLGLALGAVEGLLVVFVLVLVFNALLPYLQAENVLEFAEFSVEQTHIFKFINNINPLNAIVKGIMGGN